MNRTRVALVLSLALAGAASLPGCGEDPYAGLPEHAKRRHLALEGAPNFRDLGGYATADGRRVKWGLLYRSDHLANLTDSDLARLRGLGLRLVCDLRAEVERQAEPDRLPAPDAPAVASFPIVAESFMVADLRERIASGRLEGLDLEAMLLEGYRQFATRYAAQYAALLERLAQPASLPAVLHCTAGKDRAGFGAALILTLLGVPRETVMDDFLLTNHYTADATRRRLWMIELFSLFRADSDALRPLFGVEPAYLEAAFEALEAQYGDFERYRREALGVDDAELAAFRALALE